MAAKQHDHQPETPSYGRYPSEIDGHAAWVSVSVDWMREPDARKTNWLHVRFPYSPALGDGLPSDKAIAMIDQAEDLIVALLEDKLKAEHVGSVSAAGMRHVYFYAPSDRGLADALRLVPAQVPTCNPSAMSRVDKEHKLFEQTLEPDLAQFEFMKNAWVLEQLSEHGDKHAAEHRIEHYAYFPTVDARTQFIAGLVEGEYEVEEEFAEERDGAKAYGVRFTHSGPIEIFELSDRTSELAGNAMELDGEYEGWETEPVTG